MPILHPLRVSISLWPLLNINREILLLFLNCEYVRQHLIHILSLSTKGFCMYYRNIIIILICALYCSSAFSNSIKKVPDSIHLLFVGNSLTYTNNLPALVSHLGKLEYKQTIKTDMIAFGGASINQHLSNNLLTIELIKSYDYLVIQENGGFTICFIEKDPDEIERCNDIYQAHLQIAKIAKSADVPVIYLGTYQFKQHYSNVLVDSEKLITNEMDFEYVEISSKFFNLFNKEDKTDLLNKDGWHPGKKLTWIMAEGILERLGLVQKDNLESTCTDFKLFPANAQFTSIVSHSVLNKLDKSECWNK